MTLNNAIVVADLYVFADVNLFLMRNPAGMLLIYGLIWGSE